jgi:membrane-associated phospholipid phosphatase
MATIPLSRVETIARLCNTEDRWRRSHMAWRLVAAIAVTTMIGAAEAPKPLPQRPEPYLGRALPDTYKILPPAPVSGTTRYEADRTIFLQTRKLKDTPRWAMAQGDVNSAGLVKTMSCSVGVDLTPQATPKTVALLFRAARDVSLATNLPKDIYKRQRPYLIDEGPTCVDKTDDLAKSPDYPSGHNTWGWTVGLILAELGSRPRHRDPVAGPRLWRKPPGLWRPQSERGGSRPAERLHRGRRPARLSGVPPRHGRRPQGGRRRAQVRPGAGPGAMRQGS